MGNHKQDPLAVARWRDGGADKLASCLAVEIRHSERRVKTNRWFVLMYALLAPFNILLALNASEPGLSWLSAFWCFMIGTTWWQIVRKEAQNASLWRFALKEAEADDDSRAQMLEDELAACRPMGNIEHRFWCLVLEKDWKWVFWLVPKDIAANRMLLSTRLKYAESMAKLDIMDSKGADTRWLRYRTSGAWDKLQRAQNMEDN